MNDQKFEDLAKKYPDLFHKARVDYFAVGYGWYHILETLCGLISSRVTQARHKLQYAKEENSEDKFAEHEKELADAIEELPAITQVKEKYGLLRFYVDGGTESVHNYITFAESMARRTCKECGAPGEPRNDGCVRVLCGKHHKVEEKESESGIYPHRIDTTAKLSDKN